MGQASTPAASTPPGRPVATVATIADPKLFGYTTGQVFAANGGMYLD